MPVDYELDAGLDQRLRDLLLLEEFVPYVTYRVGVRACLKVTTDKDSEELVPCKGARAELKKISPFLRVFLDDSGYVMVVDAYTWNNARPEHVNAWMHHALMRLEFDVSDTEVVTVKTRKFDVCEYRRTVVRYGLWNDDVTTFSETLTREGLVTAMNAAAASTVASVSGTDLARAIQIVQHSGDVVTRANPTGDPDTVLVRSQTIHARAPRSAGRARTGSGSTNSEQVRPGEEV